MLIRLGYDLRFDIPQNVPVVALLSVHPSREGDLREPDVLQVEPALEVQQYFDVFGNRCSRFLAPQGSIRLYNNFLIEDSGLLDELGTGAQEIPVDQLPPETLQYLLASRYCEVDLLTNVASELFGNLEPGWGRVMAVCGWVHSKVTFGYNFARPTKTAMDVYIERAGVCRDFQHLAISFCRALNIPARYATGYLGDIGIPPPGDAMDFSAWFEVYLGGRWWTVDARHNHQRIGRVLMAVGRDAADVALTTSFGRMPLRNFFVVSDEVKSE